MTKDQINKLVAMYIVAIGTGGQPNSHVWMAIDKNMSSIDLHQSLVDALVRSGLVKQSNFFLTLTETGLVMLGKIEALYPA